MEVNSHKIALMNDSLPDQVLSLINNARQTFALSQLEQLPEGEWARCVKKSDCAGPSFSSFGMAGATGNRVSRETEDDFEFRY
jgi:hypothetical protein